MDITNSGAFGKSISDMARDASVDKRGGVFGAQVSTLAHSKKDGPSDPTAADGNVSITIGDPQNSLALVSQTAVVGVNRVLESAELGIPPVQAPTVSESENSPETTAEQVVTAGTIAFGAFQETNPELSLEDQLTQFISLISIGIDEGFAEARSILEAAAVLESENEDSLYATYQLIQEKLTAFVDRLTNTTDAVTDTIDVEEQAPEELIVSQ